MILSDKQLQPVKRSDKHDPCCICGQTHSPRFFYDPSSAKFYCAKHTTFEDLDPLAKLNQSFLYGVPTSRSAAFPELTDLGTLLSTEDVVSRRALTFYLRVENHPGQRVTLTPAMAEWLVNNLIYARPDPDQYFFDVKVREWEGRQLAYLHVKYQTILGGRLLGIVELENLHQLLGIKS